ncbi:DVU0772 family protein [Candidatus Electronema sp. JM]|uniref:DVU0772 family protein n=1 Tax=Candidatus Electronema sp. JM TaxID=3401571 RepID=UPI003AA807D8
MGLFDTLQLNGNPTAVDWEMTPEYTFGTFESWGGKERIRSSKERIYYFFIDAWGKEPKLCLMERGIKYARVVAEILAPPELLRRCVERQGRTAYFERTLAIDEELKQWLIANVMSSEDNSKVLPVASEDRSDRLGPAGLPGMNAPLPAGLKPVALPDSSAELTEDEADAMIRQLNLLDHERNPAGQHRAYLVDNGDGLTVTDKVSGLIWQRGGIDIMSNRMLRKAIEELNREGFAGQQDWRLPTLAEALSLMQPELNAKMQYLHPAFSSDQPFIFVDAVRKPGGQWFVDFKQGRAYWASATIPGGFGRLCRKA